MHVGRPRGGATRIFPFGFRRHPIGLFLPFAQPLAKRLGIGPRDIDHRMIIRLLKARALPGEPGLHLVDLPGLVDAVGPFAVAHPRLIGKRVATEQLGQAERSEPKRADPQQSPARKSTWSKVEHRHFSIVLADQTGQRLTLAFRGNGSNDGSQ